MSFLGEVMGLPIQVDPSLAKDRRVAQPFQGKDARGEDSLNQLLEQEGLGVRLDATGIIVCEPTGARGVFTKLPPVVED